MAVNHIGQPVAVAANLHRRYAEQAEPEGVVAELITVVIVNARPRKVPVVLHKPNRHITIRLPSPAAPHLPGGALLAPVQQES